MPRRDLATLVGEGVALDVLMDDLQADMADRGGGGAMAGAVGVDNAGVDRVQLSTFERIGASPMRAAFSGRAKPFCEAELTISETMDKRLA